MSITIGFIGFGEVASILSKQMREKGAQVVAYDILLSQERGREILQKRVRANGIKFCPLPDVVKGVKYVLSTVTTQVAEKVAKDCSTHLKPGQVYVDFNSTTPSVKMEICKIIDSSGADFVEGAILGAVGATGARTRILVGGKKAREVNKNLTRLGLNVYYYSSEIGKASMFKMLRSIFSKGLEALLLELLIAGKRAGIESDLWKDITAYITNNPFDQVASNLVQTHAVAYERRYHEMVQVAETMSGIGIEPVITSATIAFFKRSLSFGLKEAFPKKPESMEELIDFIEKRLAGRNNIID